MEKEHINIEGRVNSANSFTIYNNLDYLGEFGYGSRAVILAKVTYLDSIKLPLIVNPTCERRREKIDLEERKSIVEGIFYYRQRIPFKLPIEIKPYQSLSDERKVEKGEKYYIYKAKGRVVCVKSIGKSYWVMDWKDATKEIQDFGIDVDASSKTINNQQIYKLLNTRPYNAFQEFTARFQEFIENLAKRNRTDSEEIK